MNPSSIAAAVQGYVKALRILGHERTSIGKIADTLSLSDVEVTQAFENYRISGAQISDRVKTQHIRTGSLFTPVVELAPKRKLSRYHDN